MPWEAAARFPSASPNRIRFAAMKLTDKSGTALALGGKLDRIEFDDDMPRFGYRLRKSAGGKLLRSWIVQYRRGGGTRRISLGSADVVSASQARAAAKQVLAKVDLGEDPQADRIDRRGKDQLRLEGVIAEFLATKEPHVRRATFKELRRYLTGVYWKPLHALPIDTIARKDVA